MPDPRLSLRTPRLLLVPPTAADAQDLLTILADPRTVRHNPSDGLRDLQQAAELLGRWVDQWEQYGYGYWWLRPSATSAPIGYSGVKVVSFHGEPALNLVYRLSPAAWGRGLATEAASAVVTWTAQHVPELALIARVRPDNLPSQRVATKAGLRRAPELDDEGEDGPDLVFARPPRPDVRPAGPR